MPHPRQPYVHHLTTIVAAPSQVLSRSDGQILAAADEPSVEGVIHADVRVLSRAVVMVDGEPGEHIAAESADGEARFTSILRHVGPTLSVVADPSVRLERVRRVQPGLLTETLIVSSLLPQDAELLLTVELAAAADPIARVRSGKPSTPRSFGPDSDRDHPDRQRASSITEAGAKDSLADGAFSWSSGDLSASVAADDADLGLSPDGSRLTVTWKVVAPRGGEAHRTWTLTISDPASVVIAPATPPMAAPSLSGHPDDRLATWLELSIEDLNGLRMATREAPHDTFLAAGAPWYLTLFGRDSIWAARMLLPVDPGIAGGTLRTLARLQGKRVDPAAAEEPGKILHELRRGRLVLDGLSLPPVYYGTIDATPLWICLLHDAWLAGIPDSDVADLLPALRAALGWLTGYGDPDGDGFLEYHDAGGHGLANQGWKDSADSVRFADGTIAKGPIALCEVQGYAYEAAMSGAAVLDALGEPGADTYRQWAAGIADRFRTAFWCGDGEDRFPAMALDGSKRQVDSLTSNIGHLLGTGILNAEEEALVARRLSSEALDSGLGLRTMAATDGGYAPLSYHCGSVWPHDTAIAIAGLHKAGLAEHASGLIEGLLRASVAFDQRLPELWSGEGRPVPYPAACRPQAWSAASAVVVAQALGALP